MDQTLQRHAPMYHPSLEHDSCGVGLVADIQGRPSREIVEKALAGLVNLTHRGGVGADARTGDGAGIQTQIPHALLAETLADLGSGDLGPGEYAVAMTFLPREREVADGKHVIEYALEQRGLHAIGWRQVPIDPDVLGETARGTLPDVWQAFIARPEGLGDDAFEKELMIARRIAERQAAAAAMPDFFICSISARTIVYKGFCLPEDLARFYLDLQDERVVSAVVLFHQRYSTNTFPTWGMAQPFRYIAHNGEINTVQGNRRWMLARQGDFEMDGVDAALLAPAVSQEGSDSLSFDNALELLHHGGRSLPRSLMMMVPEPWEQLPEMDPARRAFYDFHAGLIEQWDGPAAIAFSDGVLCGATLDRNGLRPLRYAITRDGLFVAGSEAGTVEIDQATVIEKGRLGPGEMILVDTALGLVLRNDDLKGDIASQRPYRQWLDDHRVRLDPAPAADEPVPVPLDADLKTRNALTKTPPEETALQRAFGYTAEDIRLIVSPMAGDGKEPTWSMGDDAPLAVLAEQARPVSAYFRQRFAQVTNPAIDSLRERKVMALDAFIGPRGNLLVEAPEQARLIHLDSLVLAQETLDAIVANGALPVVTISTAYPVAAGAGRLATELDRVVGEAEHAARAGAGVLVLSDRGVDDAHVAVPMAMAAGAIHNGLIAAGLRSRLDIVADSGEVWDVHQLCVLVGYGVSAVHPRLALRAAAALSGQRGFEEITPRQLRENYLHALEAGFLKISAKMGISTASGYRGAQIFEIIGLSQEIVDRAFAGTISRVGGLGFAELEGDLLARHAEAYGAPMQRLPDHGLIKYKRDGESHAYAPPIVKAIQQAAHSHAPQDFQTFLDMVKDQPPTTIRDLLAFVPAGDPVPLEEVESEADIIARFIVTAMSLGSLSPEAHSTLSVGMNRLGARSNSGEGGEDPHWYDAPGPDRMHAKVKQVASGRFGVTPRYLSKADELEIKISQGSKPGEGGQIPGHKVTDFIARMRHAVPGLPLISPPPHHDIYSIEDLAQLIYDLRQVNPRAKIGVKLVAESGVGTVAAGVAKARADYILVSGHSGGTGASPLASIKHAGCPWELGLAETQQTLVLNGLRSRVKLRTDGGIKTPDDILTAILLGAEEIGFGTSALVSIGCDMARQCHLNTCPTGIATQRADLRAKFAGTPEHVVAWFEQIASATRSLMAALGIRKLDDVVGRTDLLKRENVPGRAALLDLSGLLAEPAPADQRRKTLFIDHNAEPTLDDEILAEIAPKLAQGEPIEVARPIRTENRTVGARIAGYLTVQRESTPTPLDRVTCAFTGSAGQSFGAFNVAGLRLRLQGEANDYVAKGMGGGEIAIMPPAEATFEEPQAIAGNTILYGATGGTLFIAGKVGERFAVRNSGATAVVEGVGDHGCEYMTGGRVVVLGETGLNFGAGMTNGEAWVWDPAGAIAGSVNAESVAVRPGEAAELAEVRSLVERHVAATGSARGRAILADWEAQSRAFWLVESLEAVEAARLAVEAENETDAGTGAAD
jgi:glutamate synthase domain-containing protein 2/glutamate synthase domain-containing protein 1/glutamate synthase domain-containing protein 3